MTPRRIKEIRTAAGLSQAQLARLLGVDTRSARRWELGEREIGGPAAMILEMIEAGDLPARYLEAA